MHSQKLSTNRSTPLDRGNKWKCSNYYTNSANFSSVNKTTAKRHTSSMLHVPSGIPGIGNTNKSHFFQLFAMGKKKYVLQTIPQRIFDIFANVFVFVACETLSKRYWTTPEILTTVSKIKSPKCLLECEKRDSGVWQTTTEHLGLRSRNARQATITRSISTEELDAPEELGATEEPGASSIPLWEPVMTEERLKAAEAYVIKPWTKVLRTSESVKGSKQEWVWDNRGHVLK